MNAVVNYQPPAAAPAIWRGVQPGDFDSAIRMAKAIAQSGMAPKSYYQRDADPVAAVFTAMQLGAEIGLSPMSAVRSIAVINGMPGLYGPAMLGVVEASGKLAAIDEGIEGEDLARHAWCTVQRVGRTARTFKFSMADAKQAGLMGKAGPWKEYPDRMLLARARTYALRDVFPDILLGLSHSVEELADIPPDAPPEQQHIKARVPPPQLAVDAGRETAVVAVRLPDGATVAYPRTRAGLQDCLKFIGEGGAQLVMLNHDLMDRIAERVPHLADTVADIRAAAAKELAPDAERYPGEAAGAEAPEPPETDTGADLSRRRSAAELPGGDTVEPDPFGLPPLRPVTPG